MKKKKNKTTFIKNIIIFKLKWINAMFGNDDFSWKFEIGLNLLFDKSKFSNLDLN